MWASKQLNGYKVPNNNTPSYISRTPRGTLALWFRPEQEYVVLRAVDVELGDLEPDQEPVVVSDPFGIRARLAERKCSHGIEKRLCTICPQDPSSWPEGPQE